MTDEDQDAIDALLAAHRRNRKVLPCPQCEQAQERIERLERLIKLMQAALEEVVESIHCVDGYRNVSISEEAERLAEAALLAAKEQEP